MNKHTPGSWTHEGQGDITGIEDNGFGRGPVDVCSVYLRTVEGRHEANARLIAAAPDLLEALESVSQEHDLLRWMKNIEMRRRQGSFGIAVADDSDAIGWQEQAEKLKVLVDRRESAIARARGEV